MKGKLLSFLAVVSLIAPAVFFLGSPFGATSDPSCSLAISVTEHKTVSGITFSLASVDVDARPPFYWTTGPYTLEVQDASGKVLDRYPFPSGRYISYDTRNPALPGGEMELDSGSVFFLIPYAPAIARLVVLSNGTTAELTSEVGSFVCPEAAS